MEETTKQLTTGAAGEDVLAADPDKTLVQPRFDVREERTAQPVVPLAQAPARGGRLLGSSLPVVLILVSAVVGGLVSVFAYRAYQRPAQPAAQGEQRRQQAPAAEEQQTPAAEAAAEQSPTPELVVAAQAEDAQPAEQQPSAEGADTDAAEAATAVAATREERAAVKEDRRPEAAAPRRTDEGARPERVGVTARARRVDVITGPTGERVSRRERDRDDSEIEGEATDYESPAARRARRRAARRAARRNVDRVRAIFEGDPPRLD